MSKTKARRLRDVAERTEIAALEAEPTAQTPNAIRPDIMTHLGCEACQTLVAAGADMAGQQAAWDAQRDDTYRRYAYDSARVEDGRVLLAAEVLWPSYQPLT